MNSPACSSEKFDGLEGASVNVYVAAFPDDLGRADPEQKKRFRCCVCGREWEKRAPDKESGGTRARVARPNQSVMSDSFTF